MFSGTPELVSLQFDNSLIHAVIDRFGMDVEIVKSDDQHFTIEVEAVTENSFYSWLFLFGQRVKILGPQHVQEHMHTMAQAVLKA